MRSELSVSRPAPRLWAVQVTNKKNAGSTRSVLCGIDWVTGTRTDADPTNDIQVANMSLGGPLKGANTGKPDDENCGITQHDVVHQADLRVDRRRRHVCRGGRQLRY